MSRSSPSNCSAGFTIMRRNEEPTAYLAWQDGVLMQKWEVSDVRDYGDCSSLHEYSEWRPVPTLPNAETVPTEGGEKKL